MVAANPNLKFIVPESTAEHAVDMGVPQDKIILIDAGQTVAILGESGCGKTVLMKSIVGLTDPRAVSGRILFDDSEQQYRLNSFHIWLLKKNIKEKYESP